MDTDFTPETTNVPAVSYPTQMSGLVTEIHSDRTVRAAESKDLPGLIHFNRARRELELASSIDEVKQIRDQAEAMRIYARQVRYSLEMQNMCAEIKLRAERKLGEMLKESNTADRGQANLLRGRTMQPRDDGPLLKDLGISKSQSSRCQMIASIDADSFEEKIEELKVPGKELTSSAMVDFAKYRQREQARATEQEIAIREGEAGDPSGNTMILPGDFREVLTDSVIAEGSVDLVLTDPPYVEQFLPLWSDLGRFAARVLKPGKILATYSGIYHLDKVMERLGEHLQYLWTAILINHSQPDTVFPRHIMTYWKPVLLFSNGDYQPLKKREWFRDRIEGDGRVKDHHEWQQGLYEARQLVEALTHEGNLVVDPLAGSGTTGVACKQLKRRYLGCDVDEASIISARKRIQQGR